MRFRTIPAAVTQTTIHGIAGLVLATTFGCQFSEDRFLRRAVSPTELHGKWQATPYAIKSLSDIGHTTHLRERDHTLELRSDGTCTLQSFLQPAIQASPKRPVYLSSPAPCSWSVTGSVPRQQISIVVPAFLEYPEFRHKYYFSEEDGRIILWFYVTDPDAWQYIEFERLK